jgi:hypothetical protein
MSGVPETPEGYDYLRAHADYWSAIERQRHSILLRPKVFRDGSQWCCLYGDNLQDGVAGFGDSPDKAMRAFDAAMVEDIKATVQQEMQE